MNKKDMFIHGTLDNAINWNEFFDPKNQGESFQEKERKSCINSKSDSRGKKLAKVRVNPHARNK